MQEAESDMPGAVVFAVYEANAGEVVGRLEPEIRANKRGNKTGMMQPPQRPKPFPVFGPAVYFPGRAATASDLQTDERRPLRLPVVVQVIR